MSRPNDADLPGTAIKEDERKDPPMNEGIAEAMEALMAIIRLQTDIIDRLAMEVLQHAEIADEELHMISQAVTLQKDAHEKGYLTR